MKLNKMIKKTVIIFGVFDNIHNGHLHLIKNAKREGDKLLVIVARDKIVKKLKNKFPKQTEKERLSILSKISYFVFNFIYFNFMV